MTPRVRKSREEEIENSTVDRDVSGRKYTRKMNQVSTGPDSVCLADFTHQGLADRTVFETCDSFSVYDAQEIFFRACTD